MVHNFLMGVYAFVNDYENRSTFPNWSYIWTFPPDAEDLPSSVSVTIRDKDFVLGWRYDGSMWEFELSARKPVSPSRVHVHVQYS